MSGAARCTLALLALTLATAAYSQVLTKAAVTAGGGRSQGGSVAVVGAFQYSATQSSGGPFTISGGLFHRTSSGEVPIRVFVDGFE